MSRGLRTGELGAVSTARRSRKGRGWLSARCVQVYRPATGSTPLYYTDFFWSSLVMHNRSSVLRSRCQVGCGGDTSATAGRRPPWESLGC